MLYVSGINMKDFTELETKLGIQFKNKDLLQEALTHCSFLNEGHGKSVQHNERLEFLGDAVLELSVTEFLFCKFPNKPEGELTAFRAALVNSNMLFEVASNLNLEKWLRLSKGETKEFGKGRNFILANTLEAVIGAIYLDQGGEVADVFIKNQICSKIDEVLEKKLWCDAKSLFQERAQEVVGVTPSYEVLKESGPDHKKHFIVGIFLEDEMVSQGEGFSKQDAQRQAAENALKEKGWED